MRGFRRGIVLLAVLGAACASRRSAQAPEAVPAAQVHTDAATAAAAPPGIEVRDVRVEPLGGGRRVLIALNREPDGVQDYTTATPSRLVIDMPGPLAQSPMPVTRIPLPDELVSQARVGSHEGILRVVLDLARAPGTHVIRREGTTVVAEIGDVAAPAPDAAAAAPGAADESWLAVRDVRVETAGTGRRLVIGLTRTPDRVKEFVLDSPPRLVIDLTGPQAKNPAMAHFPMDDSVVTRVRAASNGATLRVVADLRQAPGVHVVRKEGHRLVAELGDIEVSDAAPVDADSDAMFTHAVATEPLGDRAAADEAPAPFAVQKAAFKEKPAADVVVPPADDHAGAQLAAAPVAVERVAEVEAAAPPLPPAVAPADHGGLDPMEFHATAEPVRRAPHRPFGTAPPVFTGQRISLDFKDADIQNVLRVLADVSQLNIIATDDVKGKVTLHLTDVPWDQALDLVLRSNRLEKTQEGNVVRISTVARLKEEREALRAAEEAETELEPLRVRYVKVNYARADDTLVDKIKGVLTDRGSVTFDDRTNTIIVRDISRGIDDAGNLIRELDVQSPQVLIEANIVEATEDFARGLGVQWGYGYKAGPQTGNPTGMNFPGTVGIGGSGLNDGSAAPSPGNGVVRPNLPFIADFPVPSNFGGGFGAGAGSALDLALGSIDGTQSISARLTALEEQGKGKVISRPRVITMNNVAATIQSLTILRVKLPSTGTVINTGTGGAAGSASTATEKINTGITLVVTPQISADGYVLMNIYAKSSQPDFTKSVDGIPNEVSREANSNVLIRDGETVVLGGIFRNTSQDNESGLPYLRSIPGLGWLFKRNLKASHHEELLVFLSPKIVSAGTAALPVAEKLWEERRQGG